MTTIKMSESSTKEIRITRDGTGRYCAALGFNYGPHDFQVLRCKWYNTENGARRWAKKQLQELN